ncbi:unnamed protein product [Bathycoccus prasinos]
MTTTTTKKKQTTTTKTTTTTTTTRRKKKESSTYSSSFLRRQIILPISDVFVAIKSMNVRQLTLQLLSLTLIVTSALMIWKSLCLYTHSESPVVVVLSGSMEPAFKRGDILFLSLKKIKEEDIEEEERKTRVGEIIVFSIDGREIPIMLTKGDNNYMDDIGLYAPGQKWLNEKHVMGRTVGYLPHVGKATILMNDHPMIKYALIFILGLLVISGKEG